MSEKVEINPNGELDAERANFLAVQEIKKAHSYADNVLSERYAWVDNWRPKKLSHAKRRGRHLGTNYRKKKKIFANRTYARVTGEWMISRLNEEGYARRILPATPAQGEVNG